MSHDLPTHFASRRDAEAHILIRDIGELERIKRLNVAQKARLKQLRQRLAALQSPIHKLSDDVLSYIFELACDYGADPRIRWTVSQVSSRWRDVAIHTSSLWINIRITRAQRSSRSGDRIETLLERCGSRLLMLTVDLSGLRREAAYATLQSAGHWTSRAMTLHVLGRYEPMHAMPYLSFSAELLNLTITGIALYSGGGGENWLDLLKACLPSCPRLRELCLSGLWPARPPSIKNEAPSTLSIELSHLEVITLGEGAPLRLFKHLHARPKVATFPHLPRNGLYMAPIGEIIPLAAPNLVALEELSLRGEYTTRLIIESILAHTPSLRVLNMRGVTLLRCGRRSAPLQLTTINVYCCHFAEGLRDIIGAIDATFAKETLTVHLDYCIHSKLNPALTAERKALSDWLESRARRFTQTSHPAYIGTTPEDCEHND